MVEKIKSIFVVVFITSNLLFSGTSGKIVLSVSDKNSRDAIVGANVSVVGTNLGGVSNFEGLATILNVSPGVYKLKISMLGYTSTIMENVRVNIDQTTNINVSLIEENIVTQEVIVIAERPAVQKDVSASTTNLNVSEFENLPAVQNVASVMGLQAGVQISSAGDIIIRGGGADQTAVMLNGASVRDERTNKSFTGINLSSVEDIQIQTGGFNAEYGNIRSGIVNITTKEGSREKYNFNFISRYSPEAQKHFGPGANDRNSFWMRPYLDDQVAWTGTRNGVWNEIFQKQFPYFEGWISVANKTLQNDNPNDDLTPLAAQKLFLYQHRKDLDIHDPDYDLDFSFSGPIPFVSKDFWNLRFLASYRKSKSMLLVPLNTPDFNDENYQLKLTADLTPTIKLNIEGLNGKSFGTNDNNSGNAGIFSSSSGVAAQLNRVSYIDGRIFSYDYWAPTKIGRNLLSFKLTNLISQETFYETSLSNYTTSYSTNPDKYRDTNKIVKIGNNYFVDEAPFGFWPWPTTGIDGLRMSVGFSNSRDSSKVSVLTAKFDITSQVNKFNQVKAGVEFSYTENNVNYASVDIYLPSGRSQSKWLTYPKKGAIYLQDKLEFEGMIANIGLRWDYSHAGGEWYSYDYFNKAFSADKSLGIDTLLEKNPTKKIMSLSPRVGISFPISIDSKIYFNYGHFRSLPTPENLYLIRRYSDNNQVTYLADPNKPFPTTIAYELGYEHNLFEEYLFHLAGYYKDVKNQPTVVEFISRDSKVKYDKSTSNSYADIRGIEISLTKNRGDWVRGFINYTYQVSSSGRFGFAKFYESSSDQRNYERTNFVSDIYQSKPVPQPYGRTNIDFFTPLDFGPKYLEIYPLADLRLSFLGSYSSGSFFTWAGGGSIKLPGLENNVQWKSYYNLDLRFSKALKIDQTKIEFFVDVSNLFNFKNFSSGGYGFKDGNDFDDYMKSLHLPDGVANKLQYGNIPGSDRPGDFRDFAVEMVPMVSVNGTATVAKPVSSYIYYDLQTKKFMQFLNNSWVDADQSFVDKIVKDKAYIDMPNLNYFTFLNPRDIFFGLKLTFEF